MRSKKVRNYEKAQYIYSSYTLEKNTFTRYEIRMIRYFVYLARQFKLVGNELK